jgi:hypothetical protein
MANFSATKRASREASFNGNITSSKPKPSECQDVSSAQDPRGWAGSLALSARRLSRRRRPLLVKLPAAEQTYDKKEHTHKRQETRATFESNGAWFELPISERPISEIPTDSIE